MIHLIGSSGLGDAILSLQASFYVNQPHKNHICARDEVFKPLQYLFNGLFTLTQWPEEYVANYRILHDKKIQDEICGSETDERYFVLPDLLFRGPLAFDYKKFNTNPQLIRSTRLLTNRYRPGNNKIIYCALSSTTDGYLYADIASLLRSLAAKLPDYNIVFPKITRWADKKIDYGNLFEIPGNVYILENPDFCECIDIMAKSEFAVCTDCGPYHIFSNYGCPVLLLDPQFNKPAWQARWRNTTDDSVPIGLPHSLVSNLIEILIKEPTTQLLPRMKILELLLSGQTNWAKNLMYKF